MSDNDCSQKYESTARKTFEGLQRPSCNSWMQPTWDFKYLTENLNCIQESGSYVLVQWTQGALGPGAVAGCS
eukprot:scaffold67581_cov14-Tisochrysis_lutea.AAC.1